MQNDAEKTYLEAKRKIASDIKRIFVLKRKTWGFFVSLRSKNILS
jgi:hypothetical protein